MPVQRRALAALACIYFFYTIPLVAAQALVHPQRLKRVLPDIEKWQESSVFIANIFSGLIPALIYTAFFAVCPALFKVISNFGSNATSSVGAGKVFHCITRSGFGKFDILKSFNFSFATRRKQRAPLLLVVYGRGCILWDVFFDGCDRRLQSRDCDWCRAASRGRSRSCHYSLASVCNVAQLDTSQIHHRAPNSILAAIEHFLICLHAPQVLLKSRPWWRRCVCR